MTYWSMESKGDGTPFERKGLGQEQGPERTDSVSEQIAEANAADDAGDFAAVTRQVRATTARVDRVLDQLSEVGELSDPECPDIETAHRQAWARQVGGDHYKRYAIQPYEFFFKNNISHHKAAIIRRILRYDQPTGRGAEDLDKIAHELELIRCLEGWQ